ncbi:MAG: exopolysaccharide biosynthesis polyprenyl glycosylphosphotransferase [Leptotrichiaceae bacterium]|nr:exopolysaccharide biosynthesis polyprenyl glycosylphosphotransferase [Leptotrichiaceae bacterium]MBP7100891.1 exopolysaccharide biosynthesis polyprenyl glycosylphosphotransferase [Leptotrichiaceae bacterium]MBP7725531.1 exopolysaccharide biosynthesis polyprenyl glycosylphosphotransferase [Leptotrichiaceae bacterium]
MNLKKNFILKFFYVFFTYILYWFLLNMSDYSIKYLVNFIFLIYIFVKFIFSQLKFNSERFRLKDIFVTLGINITFSIIIFIFLKKWDIFLVFGLLAFFQIILRFIICLKYSKKRNVLIFGSNHIKNNVQEDIINTIDYNYVGYISNNESCSTKYKIGNYNELERIIDEKKIDILVIVKNMKSEDFKTYMFRLFNLKVNGLKIYTYEEFNENVQKKIDISTIDEEWLLQSYGFDILNNESQKNIKRGLDLIIAIILFIFTLPIMILVAVFIKLESEGPIIFKQVRVGENKKKFNIYKFRTMKMHDPKKYSNYATNEDDRITKIGKFMRKTRIDELPQLWNVIKGTMSFMGPRPEWDILSEKYEKEIEYYNLRHLVKPGITGWAQVMYPYGECIEDTIKKLEYDLYYIKKQDLLIDVLIIMKTVKIVIFGKGK